MSIKVLIKNMSDELKTKIDSDLTITINSPKNYQLDFLPPVTLPAINCCLKQIRHNPNLR